MTKSTNLNYTQINTINYIYDQLKAKIFDKVNLLVDIQYHVNKYIITIKPEVGIIESKVDEEGFIIPSRTAHYVFLSSRDEKEHIRELAYLGFMSQCGIDNGEYTPCISDKININNLESATDKKDLSRFFKEEMTLKKCLGLMTRNEYDLLCFLGKTHRSNSRLVAPYYKLTQLTKEKVDQLLNPPMVIGSGR